MIVQRLAVPNRLQLLALGALAAASVAVVSAPKVDLTPARTPAAAVQRVEAPVSARASHLETLNPTYVTADMVGDASPSQVWTALTQQPSCPPGAYVTGDMVGDASPAQVYAELCKTH